jgi:predicted transglutaminase-like cysteine proteinase
MQLGAEVVPPPAFTQMCERLAPVCESQNLRFAYARGMERTEKRKEVMHELENINVSVNASIEAKTDQDHWGTGVVDRWDIPTDGKGDCEDFALLKRQKLLELGWGTDELLLVVARDGKGEGHAVLAAHLPWGDFILDNLRNEVLPWTQVRDTHLYVFSRRESSANPMVWREVTNGTKLPDYTAGLKRAIHE